MKTFAETALDTQLKFLFRERGLMFLTPYFIPMKLQLARLNNFKYARARVEGRIKTDSTRGDFGIRSPSEVQTTMQAARA